MLLIAAINIFLHHLPRMVTWSMTLLPEPLQTSSKAPTVSRGWPNSPVCEFQLIDSTGLLHQHLTKSPLLDLIS